MTLLSVSNVGVSFGATELFKNVTFTVADGERWGIIGRNGAGKSSIFKLITGDLQPTVGSVARKPGLRHALLDQHRGPIDEAASELERARLQLEGRQIELRQQTLQAWKELEMARLRTQALSQGSVREAESALRVAEAAYRFGERGILDVLDAQRVLRSIRADLLDARYQLQAARIQLEYLAGRYDDPSAL